MFHSSRGLCNVIWNSITVRSVDSIQNLNIFLISCSLFFVHFSPNIQAGFCLQVGVSSSQKTAKLISLLFETEWVSQPEGKKLSLSVGRGCCSELLSWLQLKLVLYLAFFFFLNKEKAWVLPVFSQPSSSLWSAQSSSPSHLHDKRTQRPVPQRNWSAMHMDVAAARHTFYSLIHKTLCFQNEETLFKQATSATKAICSVILRGSSSHSLQFFSSDWSSQSNSPSHLQPALMHIPLLHMNSTDLHGWWEAAHKHRHAQSDIRNMTTK